MDSLEERVKQFEFMKLPGQQPGMFHVGALHLVNDLWREVKKLREALDGLQESKVPAPGSQARSNSSRLGDMEHIITLADYYTSKQDQTGVNMEHLGSYNYLAVVAGGIGPDVWDKEIEIQASSIGEAVRIIEDDLQSDVRIISIEQTE